MLVLVAFWVVVFVLVVLAVVFVSGPFIFLCRVPFAVACC